MNRELIIRLIAPDAKSYYGPRIFMPMMNLTLMYLSAQIKFLANVLNLEIELEVYDERLLLNNGEKIPYGLGWFIGTYKKHRIVFHTGWQPSSFSALYVKIPNKNMTLILLANSEDLIAPFMQDLGTGNIESSPFAVSFFRIFIDS